MNLFNITGNAFFKAFTSSFGDKAMSADRVTDTEMRIIKILETNPEYSYSQLSDILDISRKSVAACIKDLKEKEVIIRVGNNKKGYWKINFS